MPERADFDFPAEVRGWIRDGRADVGRFAANGLGINLHDKQLEFLQAINERKATYYDLDWANRAGKTLALCVLHLHQLAYKLWLSAPTRDEWLLSEYRTLHCAPLNELAGRTHSQLGEILKGVSPSQRDQVTGKYREAPLRSIFSAIKERDQAGADHMVLKCLTGAATDFRSTEGSGARLEGTAWWLIAWDEWPATEGDPQNVRDILYIRLTNRASDFNAPIVLTGTRTPELEHVAKEFAEKVEDRDQPDWWGNHASRMENPIHNKAAIAVAKRNLDPEDYNRTILGIEGGVKGRVIHGKLLDRLFTPALPRFSEPALGDGWPGTGESQFTYLHLWDLALAAADNIGIVLRMPRSGRFSVADPLLGVKLVRIPGSRTLTPSEIKHTIAETFLPYGGKIVLDTTDAHGKGIYRELRVAGYPVEDFTFNEIPGRRIKGPPSPLRNIIRKDRAIKNLLALLAEGLAFKVDAHGRPRVGTDDVAELDFSKPYGAIRLPSAWTLVRDQLATLRPDDERQRKDAAMAMLMGADVATITRNHSSGRVSSHLQIMAAR